VKSTLKGGGMPPYAQKIGNIVEIRV